MTFGILRTDGILRTGELPHHILHFADRDALGGAHNKKCIILGTAEKINGFIEELLEAASKIRSS